MDIGNVSRSFGAWYNSAGAADGKNSQKKDRSNGAYGDEGVRLAFSGEGMRALKEDAPRRGTAQISKTAQAYLEKLRKTYNGMDFFVADLENGDDAKDILAGAKKEYSVILSPEELEKMASDENYAAKYIGRIQSAVRMSEQINREFGFTSGFGKIGENSDTQINKIGIAIREDGTTSYFAELEKAGEQQRERIEERREERRAKEKEDKERTYVRADSIEELLEKIRNVKWNAAEE